MKNNVRGLIFHIFIIGIVFLISLIINLNTKVTSLVYGNIVFKTILAIIPIFLYYTLGKAMSKRTNKKLDFFTGNIILVIAIILFMVAFLGLGLNLFRLEVGESMWKLPLDIFLTPQLYVYQMFNISYNVFTIFLAALLPNVIYGISIKKSRAKIAKRKRIIKNRERRRR